MVNLALVAVHAFVSCRSSCDAAQGPTHEKQARVHRRYRGSLTLGLCRRHYGLGCGAPGIPNGRIPGGCTGCCIPGGTPCGGIPGRCGGMPGGAYPEGGTVGRCWCACSAARTTIRTIPRAMRAASVAVTSSVVHSPSSCARRHHRRGRKPCSSRTSMNVRRWKKSSTP